MHSKCLCWVLRRMLLVQSLLANEECNEMTDLCLGVHELFIAFCPKCGAEVWFVVRFRIVCYFFPLSWFTKIHTCCNNLEYQSTVIVVLPVNRLSTRQSFNLPSQLVKDEHCCSCVVRLAWSTALHCLPHCLGTQSMCSVLDRAPLGNCITYRPNRLAEAHHLHQGKMKISTQRHESTSSSTANHP